MRLKRKEQSARIRVTVWKGLMQSVQSLPADTFTGFPFFHTIRYQVFHGAVYTASVSRSSAREGSWVKVIAVISSRYPLAPPIDARLGT